MYSPSLYKIAASCVDVFHSSSSYITVPEVVSAFWYPVTSWLAVVVQDVMLTFQALHLLHLTSDSSSVSSAIV